MTPVSPKTCIPHDVPAGLCAIQNILGITGIEGGLPHSEIRGSKVVRTSPRLIAAYHVLHRLLAPRHPPDTLKTLDRSHYQCPSLTSAHPKSLATFRADATRRDVQTTFYRPLH